MPALYPRVLSASTLALVVAISGLSADQSKVLAPHKPVAPLYTGPKLPDQPPVLQIATGGLWMTDPNYKSTLYLQNQLKWDPLIVTPVLYLSNGLKYMLPEVTLEPSGIAKIDLNQALAAKGIAPYATLFGYAEIQYKWAWAAVSGYVRALDTAHSLVFPFGLRPSPSESGMAASKAQLLEGMWWKEEPDVTAFVALSNATGSPINATVQATDAKNNILDSHQLTVSPHGTKMIHLSELHTTVDQGGGVQVTYSGPEDGLMINAAVEDEAVGYSASLALGPPPKPKAQAVPTTFAEIGLMAGTADPMMSFPVGTIFRPYSVVRNISDQPTTVKPTVWWMAGNEPHSASVPGFTVQSHQTQALDVASILGAAGLRAYNGSLNLVLDVQGPAQGLAMASGSIDEKNTYVFEVVPRTVLESVSKTLGHWSINNGDDTMVTLWNPADEAQDFVLNLFFTGGDYKLPVHLGPRGTEMFNVSEIIHNQIPDADGNTIPQDAREGSARIAGSRGDNEHILVVMDAGTYNVQKATCVCEWVTCDGFTSVSLLASPWAVAASKTNQLTFTETYNTGQKYNVNGQSSWNTSNTVVATVKTGLVTGVSGGPATISAVDLVGAYPSTTVCAQPPLPGCPISQLVHPDPTAPGNVFKVKHVAPSPLVIGTSGAMAIGGSGFSSLVPPLTVTVGGGVTVSNPSVSDDSLIMATYKVPSTTTAGTQNLVVSAAGNDGGQGTSSPPFPVTISATAPIPTSATLDEDPHTTYSNQKWTSCDGTQSANNQYGYMNCPLYQVNDQHGNPLNQNLTISETLTVVDQNFVSKQNSGNNTSNPTGQFQDMLALLSTSALPSNACSIVKQTVVASGNSAAIRVNCFQYNSTNVSITDVTANPSSCSKPTYHC